MNRFGESPLLRAGLRFQHHVPEGPMIQKSSPFGWIAAAVLLGGAVIMAVQTFIHFGSNPFGLALICLVGAGCLWSWLQNQRR